MSNNSSMDSISILITDRLNSSLGDRISEEEIKALAGDLTREYLRLQPERERLLETSLNEPAVIYASHDADLKLLDATTGIAAALWTITGSPVSVLAKLCVLLYRLRRTRGRLEGEPAWALLVLNEADTHGLTVTELQDRLQQLYHIDRSEDQVRMMLKGLKDVQLSDNKRTDFADEHQGRWYAVDV